MIKSDLLMALLCGLSAWLGCELHYLRVKLFTKKEEVKQWVIPENYTGKK